MYQFHIIFVIYNPTYIKVSRPNIKEDVIILLESLTIHSLILGRDTCKHVTIKVIKTQRNSQSLTEDTLESWLETCIFPIRNREMEKKFTYEGPQRQSHQVELSYWCLQEH